MRVSLQVCALLLLTCACNATQTGNPPLQPPPPVVDLTSIESLQGFVGDRYIFVLGPGAVDPPEGTVTVQNLAVPGSIATTMVEADGSFEIEFAGSLGDEIRLVVVAMEVRSTPIDLVLTAGRPTPVSRTLGDCLSLPLLVEDPPGGSIEIRNECPDPVEFVAPRWHSLSPAYSLSNEAPFTVPSGASVELMIAGPGGPQDDVLILETMAPAQDRWPVTIAGAF